MKKNLTVLHISKVRWEMGPKKSEGEKILQMKTKAF